MALKVVLALGYLALCSCTPVLLNDYIFRDGRGFAIDQAQTYGQSEQASGYATVNDNSASAYGSASSEPQNDYNDYGQVIANAEAYNTPYYNSASALAQNAGYYVPAPVRVISYEQSFEVPRDYGINRAESSSVLFGNEAVTSAKTDGQGYAQANGVGSFGITSSNANSFGQGSVSSTSNNVHGTSITATKTQGYGSAYSLSQNNLGSAMSNSQSNGGASSAYSSNNLDSSIATTNTQGFGSASSDVHNYPANDYNKNQKKIGWHIGTSYSIPSPKRVQAISQSYGGSAKSSAYTNKYGNKHTSANTQGHASANSNSGYGNQYTNSVANSNGYGSAKSSADNSYGSLNSHASSSGQGYAQSSSHHAGYGYQNPSSSNAQTAGSGSASSVVKGVNASYRVAESNANSYGSGTAQANSYGY